MSELESITHRLRRAKVVEPSMPSGNYQTTLGDEAANYIQSLIEALEEAEAALIVSVNFRSPYQPTIAETCNEVLEVVRAALNPTPRR